VLVSLNLALVKVGDSRQIYAPKGVRDVMKYNDIYEVHGEYGEEIKQPFLPHGIEQRGVNLLLPELPGGQPI